MAAQASAANQPAPPEPDDGDDFYSDAAQEIVLESIVLDSADPAIKRNSFFGALDSPNDSTFAPIALPKAQTATLPKLDTTARQFPSGTAASNADRPPRPQPRNIARLASQEHQRVKEAASIGRGSPVSADSQRDRNNSFFTGLEPQHRTNHQARSDSPSSSRSATPQQYDPADDGSGSSIRAPTEVQDRGERRSSFYGLEGHVVRPSASGRDLQQQRRQQQPHRHGQQSMSAASTSSNHFSQPSTDSTYRNDGYDYSSPIARTSAERHRTTSLASRSYASSMYALDSAGANAPPVPRLDHSHLKPGAQASLLSHAKTLELYRANAKKTSDPEVIFEFAVFMMGVAKELGDLAASQEVGQSDESSSDGTHSSPSQSHAASIRSRSASPVQPPKRRFSSSAASKLNLRSISASSSHLSPLSGVDDNGSSSPVIVDNLDHPAAKRNALHLEAAQLLKRLADRGHVPSQALLAECFADGIATSKGKQDYDRAFPLFVLAGKHGHIEACFRTAQCCEHGWGCRKDTSKATQWYKKAASSLHAGAMYRLGTAEINGDLGNAKHPRDGFKWLKRAAELAETEDEPSLPSIKALHELALLHEKGIEHVVFVDYEYAAECLAKASELGYAPSAYKLGECYEYGRMGCPMDSALSIHYYNIAAQQNHREACFALTAWYLVGSPGVLPQSDTEAYLWAKKAAEQGLPKAEYALGYFTEAGIGTPKDLREALSWFRKAAEHGDKRAAQRLRVAETGGGPVSPYRPPGGNDDSYFGDVSNSNATSKHRRAEILDQDPNSSPKLKAKDSDCIIS